MAVAEGASGDLQFLLDIVLADDDALALGAANDADLQLGGELFSVGLPSSVQWAVVAQGDQAIAGQGGQELDLEQLEAQYAAGLPGGLQARHQRIDLRAGDGEIFKENWLEVIAGLEHRVVAILTFTPQAEFGAQAIVLARRLEYLRGGRIEGCQQLDQALLLLRKLGGVVGGIELGTAHAGLFSNRGG